MNKLIKPILRNGERLFKEELSHEYNNRDDLRNDQEHTLELLYFTY
jgi:hypothetical protein